MTQTDVVQVCYTTRDIEATARSLAALEGVGPFFVTEFPLYDLVYRGDPVEYGPLQVAFGYSRDLQYELIRPPQGVASCYAEVLGDRREALHHTFQPFRDDFDTVRARYDAAGEPVVYQGTAGDARIRFGFVDSRPRLGHFIELLETERMIGPEAAIYELYGQIRAAAVDWSGQRPIRSMQELTGR